MRRIQETAINNGPTLAAVAATGIPGVATDVHFTLEALPTGSWYVQALTDTPLELHSAATVLDPETLECVCGFENRADFAVTITALAVDVED